MHSFDVTFLSSGRHWRAWVIQTEGPPVLPAVTPLFRGKSLASVHERISLYFSSLKLAECTTSYDFGSVLDSAELRLVHAVHDATRDAEEAGLRRIRGLQQAIETLSVAGFSRGDIGVLLGESKAVVQRILRDMEFLEEAKGQSAATPNPTSTSNEAASLSRGTHWYSQRHADAGLTPGAAIALEIGLEVMPETETVSVQEVSLVERLPDRFMRRYDREFLATFWLVLDDVYDAIRELDTAGLTSTPAQEIALAVLISAARHHILSLMDLGERAGARGDLESLEAFREAVTEDRDVDLLWGHENDGLEEDTERMDQLGIGKALLFENWFKPYRRSPR